MKIGTIYNLQNLIIHKRKLKIITARSECLSSKTANSFSYNKYYSSIKKILIHQSHTLNLKLVLIPFLKYKLRYLNWVIFSTNNVEINLYCVLNCVRPYQFINTLANDLSLVLGFNVISSKISLEYLFVNHVDVSQILHRHYVHSAVGSGRYILLSNRR